MHGALAELVIAKRFDGQRKRERLLFGEHGRDLPFGGAEANRSAVTWAHSTRAKWRSSSGAHAVVSPPPKTAWNASS
jgi:hypothetical protein